jgi:sucrose phosphorylase
MELGEALGKPMVKRLFELARLRNAHPAFDGEFAVSTPSDTSISLRWTRGDEFASLDVDLVEKRSVIHCSGRTDPFIVT